MLSEEIMAQFKAGEVVFNCPTQEIYDKLMIELEKHGYYWRDGAALTDGNKWVSYRENFCVGYTESYGLTFGPINMYSNIIPLSLYDFKSPSEPLTATLEVTNSTHMEALESITKTIATCKLIEKTYDIHLGIDELLEKREELLSEWESTFEVKL